MVGANSTFSGFGLRAWQVGRQKIPVVRTQAKNSPSNVRSRSTRARYISEVEGSVIMGRGYRRAIVRRYRVLDGQFGAGARPSTPNFTTPNSPINFELHNSHSQLSRVRSWKLEVGSLLGVGTCEIGQLSLIQRQERLRVLRTDVVGARADQPVVGVLLEAVRGPARDAADGKNRREQIDRDAQRVVRRRRVEVDVGIQLLLAGDQLLDAARHLEPRRVPGALAEVLRHLAQVRRARVLGTIDAVAA